MDIFSIVVAFLELTRQVPFARAVKQARRCEESTPASEVDPCRGERETRSVVNDTKVSVDWKNRCAISVNINASYEVLMTPAASDDQIA